MSLVMCLRRALFSIKTRFVYKLLLCFICFISLRYFYRSSSDSRPNGRPANPILIWWTSKFPGTPHNIQYCKNNVVCEFTNVREKRFDKNTEGFLFYGSQFDYLDLPLPRDAHKYVWGLLHEESPRNTPIIEHEPTLRLFNYSSTISRYSNVPLTLQYLKSVKDLLTDTYFVQTWEKNALLNEIAPVLYIQTDCDTSSYRDSYVKELMKYISVDSYGSCLNNKKLPDEFGGDYLNNLDSDKFYKFVARYKFTISFENAVCEDYITEKLWRPLKVGSVPIYMGSPSIRDWLPNNQSAIIANSFESPQRLAAYLEYLNIHDEKYESFLQHKISNKITNLNLIKSLEEREWKVNGYEMESFVSAFECFVCEMVHDKWQNSNFKSSAADQTHYNCPKPLPPPNTRESDNWWGRLWTLHKHRASILHKLVIQENRKNVTLMDFSASDSENGSILL